MRFYGIFVLFFIVGNNLVLSQNDSLTEQVRRESGIDPTRIQSRVAHSMWIYDMPGKRGQVTNKSSLTIGVKKWSFAAKYEFVARTNGIEGAGFQSGFGDIKFSLLNAFFVKNSHALAASLDFSIPTAKSGLGSNYFSLTPAITYAYTICPSIFLAVQPQYALSLLKDPINPDLSVLTIRVFLAKFTQKGYFFVFEPRPIIDFENQITDFIISPIIGKSLGAGFNLVGLLEFPLTKSYREVWGNTFQIGVNKNF